MGTGQSLSFFLSLSLSFSLYFSLAFSLSFSLFLSLSLSVTVSLSLSSLNSGRMPKPTFPLFGDKVKRSPSATCTEEEAATQKTAGVNLKNSTTQKTEENY